MLNHDVLGQEYPVIKAVQPDQNELKAYLKDIYNNQDPASIVNNKSVGVQQAVLISQTLLNLGFKKANSLPGKFNNDGFANLGEAQAAKELCESIAFVVNKLSQQDREKVMRFVADRQLICGSGTVNNLQEIYKIVSGQSQSIAVLIAETKREVIHNIILDAYKPSERNGNKNAFANVFIYRESLEIHYVPRIANAIKDEYGLTEESDYYSKNKDPSQYKSLLLDLVKNQLKEDAIISGVVNRILLNLPSDGSESFKDELEAYLEILGIGIEQDFIDEETGKLRVNLETHLRNVVTKHLASEEVCRQKLDEYTGKLRENFLDEELSDEQKIQAITETLTELGVPDAELIYVIYISSQNSEREKYLRQLLQEPIKKKFTLLSVDKQILDTLNAQINSVRNGVDLSETAIPSWQYIIANRIKVQKNAESELVDSLRYALENDIKIKGLTFLEHFIKNKLNIGGKDLSTLRDANGNNILHLAIKFSKSKALLSKLLQLVKKTEHTLVNKEGDSPLISAIKNHNYEAIDLLLPALRFDRDELSKAITIAAAVDLTAYKKIYKALVIEQGVSISLIEAIRNANDEVREYLVTELQGKKSTSWKKNMELLELLGQIKELDPRYKQEWIRVYTDIYSMLKESTIAPLDSHDIEFLSFVASMYKPGSSGAISKIFENIVQKLSPEQVLEIIKVATSAFETWDDTLLLKFDEILGDSKKPEKFTAKVLQIKQADFLVPQVIKLTELRKSLQTSVKSTDKELLKKILLYSAGISDVDDLQLTPSQESALKSLVANIQVNKNPSNVRIVNQFSLDKAVNTLIGTTATPKAKWYSEFNPKPKHLNEGNKAYNERATNPKAWDNKLLEALDVLSIEYNYNEAESIFAQSNKTKETFTFFGWLRTFYPFGIEKIAWSTVFTFLVLTPIMVLAVVWPIVLPICLFLAATPGILKSLVNIDKITLSLLFFAEGFARAPIVAAVCVVLSIRKICNYIPVIKDTVGFNGSITASMVDVLESAYTLKLLKIPDVIPPPIPVLRSDIEDNKLTLTAPFAAQKVEAPLQQTNTAEVANQTPQQLQRLLESVQQPVEVPAQLASTATVPTDATIPVIVDPQMQAYRQAQQEKFKEAQKVETR